MWGRLTWRASPTGCLRGRPRRGLAVPGSSSWRRRFTHALYISRRYVQGEFRGLRLRLGDGAAMGTPRGLMDVAPPVDDRKRPRPGGRGRGRHTGGLDSRAEPCTAGRARLPTHPQALLLVVFLF